MTKSFPKQTIGKLIHIAHGHNRFLSDWKSTNFQSSWAPHYQPEPHPQQPSSNPSHPSSYHLSYLLPSQASSCNIGTCPAPGTVQEFQMSLQIRIRTQIQSIKRSIHAINGRNIFSPSAASISALYCPVFTSCKRASTSDT